MASRIKILASLAFFVTGPALAGPWDAAKAVCAEAIAHEAGVDAAAHTATLDRARDGATKRVTVSLTPKEGAGATITGQCKVKRGEVTAVEIKA